MNFWIYDESFKRLAIIDTAHSSVWANRFRQCGDFQIYVPASLDIMDIVLPADGTERFIGRTDGDEMLGVVETVETQIDDDVGELICIKGRCSRSILGRRIVWDQTVINSTAEYGLRRLVTEAFISPAIADRKYDKLKLGTAHGYTEHMEAQYTGDNILEIYEAVCAAKNYGFKMPLRSGALVLDIYKPVDRRSGRGAVVFSEEYDNLAASTYSRDTTEYKSVALVAGEGEGAARRHTTISRDCDQTGLRRREMFVDARDVSSNEGAIPDAEYMAQLAERGRPDLAEAAIVETFTGAVEPVQYVYGTHYGLGDMVTIINKYGIRAEAQVLEVVESWDESGYTCEPTFG